MENELRTGGYHVTLAIDTEIQEIVEETLRNLGQLSRPARPQATRVYRTLNYDGTYDEIVQPQAAAVVLDYRTGELKAIVGSRTRPTARKTLNRAHGYEDACRLRHQAHRRLCARPGNGLLPRQHRL